MDSMLKRAAHLVFDENRNLHSALAVSAAEEIDGGSAVWLSRRLAVVTIPDGRRVLVDGPIALETSLGAFVVDNKQLTREYLEEAGAPTTRGEAVSDADDAVRLAASWGNPVVLKPLRGSEGKGVTVGVESAQDIRRAFARAEEVGEGVVIEQYIAIAEEYRCMATSTRCLSVIRRELPRVVGDGKSTIGELIDEKNAHRRTNPGLYRLPIPKDEVVNNVLAKQGLTQASVLTDGIAVQVRNIGGLSGGGEPHECTDTVPSAVTDAATRAVGAVPSLGWAGVDVVVEKDTGRAYVLELNINAGYGGATFPVEGHSRNVAAAIWTSWQGLVTADEDVEVSFPALHRRAPRLAAEVRSGWGEKPTQPLGTAFREHLDGRADVDMSTDLGLIVVTGRDDESRRFTPGAAGELDLLAPRRTAREHTKVRKFLADREIPRPQGQRVRSAAELEAYLDGSTEQFTALPDGVDWSSRRKRTLDSPVLRTTWKKGWFIQRRLRGTRMRLYCTRDAVLVVTSTDRMERNALNGVAMTQVAETGIAAVRSIPSLRWAAVDVVLRTRPRSGSTVLVEGLTVTPRLRADDVLLAGDFAAFFDRLAGLKPRERTHGGVLGRWLTKRR